MRRFNGVLLKFHWRFVGILLASVNVITLVRIWPFQRFYQKASSSIFAKRATMAISLSITLKIFVAVANLHSTRLVSGES